MESNYNLFTADNKIYNAYSSNLYKWLVSYPDFYKESLSK